MIAWINVRIVMILSLLRMALVVSLFKQKQSYCLISLTCCEYIILKREKVQKTKKLNISFLREKKYRKQKKKRELIQRSRI